MAAFVLSHVVFKNFESELLAGGQFNSITLRFFGLLYPDGRLFLSEGHNSRLANAKNFKFDIGGSLP